MGIANQSLDPRKAGMGALGAGERGRRDVWSAGGGAHAPLHLNLDALGTNEGGTGTSMLSSAPLLPGKRIPSGHRRMQGHADLARLFGGGTRARSIGLPPASTPVKRPNESTSDPARSPGPHQKAPGRKPRDADTVRRHRRR